MRRKRFTGMEKGRGVDKQTVVLNIDTEHKDKTSVKSKDEFYRSDIFVYIG